MYHQKAEWTKLVLVVIRTMTLWVRKCFSLLVSVILRVIFHAGAHSELMLRFLIVSQSLLCLRIGRSWRNGF